MELILLALIPAATATAIAAQAKPGCNSTCGELDIPYPFGTTDGCYRDENFLITCSSFTSGNPRANYSPSYIQVLNISLDGEMRILAWRAEDCYLRSGANPSSGNYVYFSLKQFTISNTKNKFTVIGCDTYAFTDDFWGNRFTTGCTTTCGNITDVVNGSCFDLKDLRNKNDFPVVINWAIGNETCQKARQNATSYACKDNSFCVDSENASGYLCKCKDGFSGNPYLPGSNGCQGAGLGFAAVLVIIMWQYLALQQRKLIKLKERFFRQNGGLILQQQLSRQERIFSETAKIFTAEELKKATKNYDDDLVIGRGGFGIVYKGFLAYNRVVAIKKSKIVDQSQIELFINEVVLLSQINHRNVVKLLGCCRELLTGRKALLFDKPEEERSLAMYFLSYFKENCLFEVIESGIVDEGNIETVKEVARLATRCLKLKGEDRPSMKEVVMELEGLRRTEKHPWVSMNSNLEESECLLHDMSGAYKAGDSSVNTDYDRMKDNILTALDNGR
ncbi:Wall-associated receptor kinase [Quillaja saponaria]|uniref:Wall-associated receptor kinase n=1 Tax=Quillaja saponaria TaxID=32244 RepID=A0AAD7LJM0_QUISA|nr:Wall-associated receptor kinase [Quillaja saponaria]